MDQRLVRGHVDIHSHLSVYPNDISGGASGATRTVSPADALELAPGWIAEMDANGLDTTVTFDFDNDRTKELVRRFPDRFRGMVVVDPRDPERARASVESCLSTGAFVGVKCSPSGDYSYDGRPYFPNDRAAWPFYDYLASRAIPILFHTGIIFRDAANPTGNRVECCRPLHLDDIARAFPELPIIVGHAGRPLWQETLCLANQSNVWIDLTWSQLPLPLYRHSIEYCLEGFGPSRMMFGSDSTPSEPGRATQLLAETRRLLLVSGCDEKDVTAVLGGNARSLLLSGAPEPTDVHL